MAKWDPDFGTNFRALFGCKSVSRTAPFGDPVLATQSRNYENRHPGKAPKTGSHLGPARGGLTCAKCETVVKNHLSEDLGRDPKRDPFWHPLWKGLANIAGDVASQRGSLSGAQYGSQNLLWKGPEMAPPIGTHVSNNYRDPLLMGGSKKGLFPGAVLGVTKIPKYCKKQ